MNLFSQIFYADSVYPRCWKNFLFVIFSNIQDKTGKEFLFISWQYHGNLSVSLKMRKMLCIQNLPYCYPAPLVPQIILISVKLNEGTDSDILMFFTAECLNRYLLVLSYQSYKNSRYLPDQSLTPAIITIRCTTTSLDREMLHQRYDNNYSTF